MFGKKYVRIHVHGHYLFREGRVLGVQCKARKNVSFNLRNTEIISQARDERYYVYPSNIFRTQGVLKLKIGQYCKIAKI